MKNKTAELIWMGLKQVSKSKVQKSGQLLKQKGGKIFKWMGIAIAAYAFFVLSSVWLGIFFSGEPPKDQTLHFFETKHLQAELKEQRLSDLVKPFQYGNYIILEDTKRLGSDALGAFALVERKKEEMLVLNRKEITIDFEVSHGFELASRVFYGTGNRMKKIRAQYKSLPPDAQQAYRLYMEKKVSEEWNESLKVGALYGWIVGAEFWLFTLGSSIALVFMTRAGIAALNKKTKDTLDGLKQSGAEVYEEELAKREKKMLSEITQHAVKANSSEHRSKSL